MAIRDLVVYDDITGEPGARTHQLVVGRSHYEIDLTAESMKNLEAALAPYIAAGHLDEAPPRRGRRPANEGPSAEVRSRTAIREWAISRDLPVSRRGQIAPWLIKLYNDTHGIES